MQAVPLQGMEKFLNDAFRKDGYMLCAGPPLDELAMHDDKDVQWDHDDSGRAMVEVARAAGCNPNANRDPNHNPNNIPILIPNCAGFVPSDTKLMSTSAAEAFDRIDSGPRQSAESKYTSAVPMFCQEQVLWVY